MSNKIAWVELETPTGDRVTASVFDIECSARLLGLVFAVAE